MIKGLLHSNTNTTAIDFNASLSQPLTIYDNYHYPVMGMVTIYQRYRSCGDHNEKKKEKITLTNLLQWQATDHRGKLGRKENYLTQFFSIMS